MMQGLLDFAKSPAGVGLLSAVAGGLAGARRGAPLNTLGAAGLAGLTGYNAASALQEEHMKRAQAEKVRQAIPTLYTKGEDGSMKFDTIAAAKLGLDPKTIKGYAEIPNAGRAKVARTQEVMGPNGMKQIVQLDDYGQQVGGGLDGYVAPQLVDTGDTKQFVTPTAGQSFQVGMSPAEQAANARGWAGIGLRGQQNDIMREQNQVMRDLGIQEKSLKVQELEAKKDERKRAIDAQRASANAQLRVIDQALNHPGRETATGFTSVIDPRNRVPGTDATDFQVLLDQIGGAAFLQGFESLKGGGAITEVEGKKAEQAIARLNRSQSDEEFKKSLEELRSVVAAGQARLGGGQPSLQLQQPAGGIKFLGFE